MGRAFEESIAETKDARAYIRVSTQRQASSGLGLAAQREAIEAYAQHKGLRILEWYEDHDTATIPLDKRPAGRKLCLDLQPGEHVLVKRHDRPFRNFIDAELRCEAWHARSISVHILDFGRQVVEYGTPGGRLIFRMFAAVAAYEREIIAERTAEAKAQERRLGKNSYVPISSAFGWRYWKDPDIPVGREGIKKIRCEETWPLIVEIADMHWRQKMSVYEIFAELRRRKATYVLTRARQARWTKKGIAYDVDVRRLAWGPDTVRRALHFWKRHILETEGILLPSNPTRDKKERSNAS